MNRLDGITGFVSVLGNDPRVKVFCRSSHVRRVVWFTNWLCDQFPNYDRDEAMLIAWCHDLNRLPFAHNLEKAIGFDQADNLPDYLENHGIQLPSETVLGIQQTLCKDCKGRPAARLAYAADSVTGFIEDPLLAITTLNVPFNSIPTTIADQLCFDKDDPAFESLLRELTVLFHNSPDQYIERFKETVFERGVIFLQRHNVDGKLFVDRPEFEILRKNLKEEFLRKCVFPINNERVSRGALLAENVGKPLIDQFKKDGLSPWVELLEMTDQQALEMAARKGLIGDMSMFYPNLPSLTLQS